MESQSTTSPSSQRVKRAPSSSPASTRATFVRPLTTTGVGDDVVGLRREADENRPAARPLGQRAELGEDVAGA